MARPSEESAFPLALLFVLLDGALWLVWLALVLFYVPRMEYTFRNFGMRLPWLTVTFLPVAHWLHAYWYVLVPFFAACLAADGVITFLLFGKAETRLLARLWVVLMLLLPLAVLLLSGLALYLPTVK
jgi:type II secretory pathway component PulF